MEHPPRTLQNGATAPELHDPTADESLIQANITAAQAEERPIDHATARCIAAQLHSGQDSALYSLASTGNIDLNRLHRELQGERDDPDLPPAVTPWIDNLLTYAQAREDHGPITGWHELWPSEPTPPDSAPSPEDDEATARQALMDRLNAASVTMLGQVATISTVDGSVGLETHQQPPAGEAAHPVASEPSSLHEGTTEPEANDAYRYPWTDAASWRADGLVPDELASDDEPNELLEAHFARQPAEQCGSTARMGWCGLLRHEGRPGGVILRENQYGRRWAWETESDDELAVRWEQVHEQYEAFREATDRLEAYTTSGLAPQLWVGSLADYNAGHLHGAWLYATLDADVLKNAIQFVLDNAHEAGAEEFAVMDYDGFGSELERELGEYPRLEVVSRLGQGIAEHGAAFAAWAMHVGPGSEEQLDRFEDHYRGEYTSMEEYVEQYLDDADACSFMRYVPERLQPYVKVDVKMLAQDMGFDLEVVEKGDGGVFVFDVRR